MTRLERIAQQRILVRQALGNLHAATELFGVEDEGRLRDMSDFKEWKAKVEEFQKWAFEEGPLA